MARMLWLNLRNVTSVHCSDCSLSNDGQKTTEGNRYPDWLLYFPARIKHLEKLSKKKVPRFVFCHDKLRLLSEFYRADRDVK
jgi:hypothetical protein